MSKPTRKVLTLQERVKVINLSKAGKSGRQIADEIGVGKTQIHGILKRKAELMEDFENNVSPDRKRPKRVTGNEEINKLTWEFFKDCRTRNAAVNGPLLQTKALKFASDLGKDTFSASNGWLSSFLKRNNIVLGAISGKHTYKLSEHHPSHIDWNKSARDLLAEEFDLSANDNGTDIESASETPIMTIADIDNGCDKAKKYAVHTCDLDMLQAIVNLKDNTVVGKINRNSSRQTSMKDFFSKSDK